MARTKAKTPPKRKSDAEVEAPKDVTASLPPIAPAPPPEPKVVVPPAELERVIRDALKDISFAAGAGMDECTAIFNYLRGLKPAGSLLEVSMQAPTPLEPKKPTGVVVELWSGDSIARVFYPCDVRFPPPIAPLAKSLAARAK